MKSVYPILFFTSTILLISLSVLLLRMLDHKAPHTKVLLVAIGIIGIIVLLVVLLQRFMRMPTTNHDN